MHLSVELMTAPPHITAFSSSDTSLLCPFTSSTHLEVITDRLWGYRRKLRSLCYLLSNSILPLDGITLLLCITARHNLGIRIYTTSNTRHVASRLARSRRAGCRRDQESLIHGQHERIDGGHICMSVSFFLCSRAR